MPPEYRLNKILDSPVLIDGIYSGILFVSTLFIRSMGIIWASKFEINKYSIMFNMDNWISFFYHFYQQYL